MRPPIDAATIAIGIALVGFGIVTLLAPALAPVAVQPILALILAASGTVGLLLTRGAKTTKNNRKEIP